jgi:hypothetical protein
LLIADRPLLIGDWRLPIADWRLPIVAGWEKSQPAFFIDG